MLNKIEVVFAVYLLVVVTPIVWVGWKDRRKQKRRHDELVAKCNG